MIASTFLQYFSNILMFFTYTFYWFHNFHSTVKFMQYDLYYKGLTHTL